MSRNTWSVCAEPGCPELTQTSRCEAHARPAWQNSTRRERVGKSGWQQQRDAQRLLKQHHGVCHVCSQPGADEVDHVVSLAHGGTDDDDNKRPIHSTPCHAAKTATEASGPRRRG